jgi:hypothetical protein
MAARKNVLCDGHGEDTGRLIRWGENRTDNPQENQQEDQSDRRGELRAAAQETESQMSILPCQERHVYCLWVYEGGSAPH